MTGACPPKPLWYRSVFKQNTIYENHAVGRSLCYGSKTCNLQHNNTILTITPHTHTHTHTHTHSHTHTHTHPHSRITWIWLAKKTQSETTEASPNIRSLKRIKVRGKKCCTIKGGFISIWVHFSDHWLCPATHNDIQLQLQFCSSAHLLCTVVRSPMFMLLLLEISVSVRKFD